MEKLKYKILTKSAGLYINVLSYLHPKKASALAYRLFSEPRIGRLERENLPAVLQDAHAETFSHNGIDFQSYVWNGNENVILLIHGWESNASRWEKMLPYLRSSGKTIVAIDGPASGLSGGREFSLAMYAEFIEIAVQKFRPESLIGHSMGGAACVYYQYKYQNAFLKNMVLLGAPSDMKTLVRNYVNLLSLNSKTVTLLENHFLQKFKYTLDDFSGKIFGASLGIRGIIAHDTDDAVVAFEEGKKIAGSWRQATFIETKGLGHAMHDDDLYRKVMAFLEG